MPATVSPLRYPGGKTQLYSYVKELLIHNNMQTYTYVEPFAGGAGLALKLLFNGDVPRIIINDFDPAIYAMWYCCLNHPDELIALVKSAELSVKEWDVQKGIYDSPDTHSVLERGFSTLFLNRTNISGIVSGGVLGGRNQNGSCKMDVRFNKETLSKKIRRIYQHRGQILLCGCDASKFINDIKSQHSLFLNIDPPYVEKGAQLYRNYYETADHQLLSESILHCPHPWIVTYDVCDLVKTLYCNYRCSKLDVRYSANIKRNANEYIFFSNSLKLPDSISLC